MVSLTSLFSFGGRLALCQPGPVYGNAVLFGAHLSARGLHSMPSSVYGVVHVASGHPARPQIRMGDCPTTTPWLCIRQHPFFCGCAFCEPTCPGWHPSCGVFCCARSNTPALYPAFWTTPHYFRSLLAFGMIWGLPCRFLLTALWDILMFARGMTPIHWGIASWRVSHCFLSAAFAVLRHATVWVSGE